MGKLSEIPIDEMIRDREDAMQDIKNCQAALAAGITHYSGGWVQPRITCNLMQIEVINAELQRRSLPSSESSS